jgi:hypothetical protein
MGHPEKAHGAACFSLLGADIDVRGIDRAGRGFVAWLRATPVATDLEIAHGRGDFVVEETGSVPVLRVKNDAKKPLIFTADMLLEGGRQNRAVERTVIAAVGSSLDVPVRCVERKRWGTSRVTGGDRFTTMGTPTRNVRTTFTRMKSASMRVRGDYALDQNGVWHTVREELEKSRVTSMTESYTALLYDGGAEERRASARTLVDKAPPDANGALVVDAESARWIELLPNRHALSVIAPPLLEELLAPGLVVDDEDVDEIVRAVFARAATAQVRLLGNPKGALGETYAFVDDRVVGAATLYDGAVAHVVAAVERV